MSIDAKRSAELGAILARNFPEARPHMIAAAVVMMQKAARAAKRRAEIRCNEILTDAEDARLLKADARAENRAHVALQDAGIPAARVKVSIGGDPRGACGTLTIFGEDGASIGGDGWGGGFPLY